MLTCLMLTLPAHHAIAIELDAHEHGSANLDSMLTLLLCYNISRKC